MKTKKLLFLYYLAFALLVFSIPFLYESFDSSWHGLITIVYIVLMLILAVWMIMKENKWAKVRAEENPLWSSEVYVNEGNFNWYKIISTILTPPIAFLFIVNNKYKVINTGLLTEKIKKEIIIKKYDASGRFLEQITYDDQGIGFPMFILNLLGAIYLIMLIYKQEKIDDERVKIVRLKAFRESFVFAVFLGWILLIYNSLSYVPSELWVSYFLFIQVIFFYRSRYWSKKI